MTDPLLDVSGCSMATKAKLYPSLHPSFSTSVSHLHLLLFLLSKLRLKEQLKARSLDRLLDFTTKPRIYWTETDGGME